MKTIFALLALAMFLFGCGSRSGHRVSKSQAKDSLVTASADTTDHIPTAEDSMDLIFSKLENDYKEFLKENKQFDLETFKTNHFFYNDSTGVSIVVSDVMEWGSIFHNADGYFVCKQGDVFIVGTYPFDEETGEEKVGDSLVVASPEELKMALLPFHVHMKEARIAVAKLRMGRSAKMKEMMQSAL